MAKKDAIHVCAIHVWYVFPKDAHTNEVFSGMGDEDFDHEYFTFEGSLMCANGKRRELWRCRDHAALAYVQGSQDKLQLKFEIYVQCENGQIRPWKFVKKQSPTGRALALKLKRLTAQRLKDGYCRNRGEAYTGRPFTP